eukprot:gene8795-18193_t
MCVLLKCLALLYCSTFLFADSPISKESIDQTNLLFIVFDDLRTELTTYGRDHMITPNFARLAERSVIFDNAYCQVAVCNPSRDSMMTGLRPDTTGTYSFQWSFRPHMIFPTRLRRSGYNTAGYGKVVHWDGDDPNVWSHGHWDGDWYSYQHNELKFMNASTQPDKTRPEEWFRDHRFTTKMIEALRDMHKKPEYFMAAIGFKLPHLAVHLPHSFYEMYKGKEKSWKLQKKELKFPSTTPAVSYRCCALPTFDHMEEEGAKRSQKRVGLGQDMDLVVSDDMRNELMLGYCGAITFLDKQIGRILDVVDELSLWSNLTIVLTSDHGIHNGEKGLWEKWTMFDESTRVPLMIHHPQSPFKGRHYSEPVELLDIYPTLNDLLGAPYDEKVVCNDKDPKGIHKCLPLQGKSLAKVILGDVWQSTKGSQMTIDRPRGKGGRGGGRVGKGGKGKGKGKGSRNRGNREKNLADAGVRRQRLLLPSDGSSSSSMSMDLTLQTNSSAFLPPLPLLDMDFAISQSWRCAPMDRLVPDWHARLPVWTDCSRDDNYNQKGAKEICVMGYSMRTIDFRYTAWLYFNRTSMSTIFDKQPFEEELYDHRGETFKDYTHMELINLAKKPSNMKVVVILREKLLNYLKTNIVFHGPYPKG